MSFFSLLRLGSIIQKEVQAGGVFERLESPLKSLGDVHFIQFRRSLPEIGEVYGLATHRNLKLAKIVAFFEYLDRRAFLQNASKLGLKSTNGVAAHTFQLLAANAARNELLERDAFLAHWYSQKPMIELHLPAHLDGINKELNDLDWEIRVFETYLGFAKTYVCLIINAKTRGFVTGSSAGKSKRSGIEKSVFEATINLYFSQKIDETGRGRIYISARSGSPNVLNRGSKS